MKRKGHEGQSPVIFVVIFLGLLLLVLWFFPSYIRSQKNYRDLQKRNNYLQIELAGKKAIADNLHKFQEEINRLEAALVDLQKPYAFQENDLQNLISQKFVEKGFVVQSYEQSQDEKAIADGWKTFTIHMVVQGSKDLWLQTLKIWQQNISPSIQLKEVKISPVNNSKKSNKGKTILVDMDLKAHLLISIEEYVQFYRAKEAPWRTPLAEGDSSQLSYFEKYFAKRLIQENEKLEAEVKRFQLVIGEVYEFKLRKKRHDDLHKQNVLFLEARQKETESLEKQLQAQDTFSLSF